MDTDTANEGQAESAGVMRRGILRFGTLIAAFTGVSAISTIGASSAEAGTVDITLPTAYIPTSEKGAPLGVATLDKDSKIPDVVNRSADQLGSTDGILGRKDYRDRVTGVAFHMRGPKQIDMRAHGYDADNTGVTSSWVAVNNAKTAVGTGGEIFFPPGRYVLDQGGIEYLAGQTIRGAGPELTTLVFSNTAGLGANLIKLAQYGQTVRDLSIDVTNTMNTTYPIRLINSTGARVINVKVNGFAEGGIYLAGSPIDSEITDYQCRGAKYGVITEPSSIINGLNISRFFIDGQGVTGDGLEINVPTGSLQRFNFSHGTISNYALSTPSNGLGVGIAGPAKGGVISNIKVTNTALDGIHLEDGGSDILIHSNQFENIGRSAVSVQMRLAAHRYEAVNVYGNTATRAFTTRDTPTPGGVYEFSGQAGSIKASRIGPNTARDCGQATKDTVGALLSSLASYCRIDEITTIRQRGIGVGDALAVRNRGANNRVATPIRI